MAGPHIPKPGDPRRPLVADDHLVDLLLVAERIGDSGSRYIVSDDRNFGTLIKDEPGGTNRPHYHSDWDEWWVVLDGVIEFHLGDETFLATRGKVVHVPAGMVHHIQTPERFQKYSLRLAIAKPPAIHIAAPCVVCGFNPEGEPTWEG